MINIQTQEKLQPEHVRAICHVDQHLDELQLSDVEHIENDMWVTGSIKLFTEAPVVSQIPSGNLWRWNQTKSRKGAFIVQRNAKVFLHKLIPRKKDKNNSANMPHLKLWYFEIILVTGIPIYVLWCERGIQQSQITEYENQQVQQDIHVGQFEFLREFMQADVACSIWGPPREAGSPF